jgi:hypothetical protein
MRRFYKTQIAALLCAGAAYGDTFKDIQHYCLERGSAAKGIHWIEECIQTVFTDEPYHLTATAVAPGAGIAAFGPAFGLVPRVRHYEFLLTGLVAVSTDGSTVGLAQATIALPTRGLAHLNDARTGGTTLEDAPADARASLTLRARRINAREQDFYGIGPNTTLNGRATYGLQQTELYAGFNNPLSSWISAGFDFSFLAPRVTSSVNSGATALASAYNEQTAPGLGVRDNFVRYEPYVTLRVPPQRSLNTRLRAGYAIFHDLGDARYSFRRVEATSKTTIPLWAPSHNTPSHRPWIANTMCPSLRSATRCSVGTLAITADVTTSYSGTGHQVPFYFDPTLGGADIENNDTLRGFRDYRFRGPNSVLFQVEYRHPVWGPLGVLSFYDLGEVALQPGELSLGGMRHDIGLGIYLHLGNRELVRFYVGFGSGEGTRATPKLPGTN